MLAAGHPDPWSYTPRQLHAFRFIAEKRLLRANLKLLGVMQLAMRGKPSEVKAKMEEWQRLVD